MPTEEQKKAWASRIVSNCTHRWKLRADGMALLTQAASEDKVIDTKRGFLVELQKQEQSQKAVYEKSCADRGVAHSTMEAYELHQLSIMAIGAQASLNYSVVRHSTLQEQSKRAYEGAMRYVDNLEDFYIIGETDANVGSIDWYEAIDTQQALLDDAERRMRELDVCIVPKWYDSQMQIRHYIDLEVAYIHGRKEEAIAAMMLYESIMTALKSRTNFDDRQDVYMRMEEYGKALDYTQWALGRYEAGFNGAKK